ncbi:hypothetical protein [Prochlorococcus marinus]|uniref:hypothetical protein n=1 Tax=Prochlorococcus marinus TaxID=1219 RepID=UPI0007BBFF85|nr:hypothetical protein [Prochlorococcus marinus]KZR74676.1 Hemolysin, plasmid [Prochlorococcus marinus str. MIT 1320]
MSNDFNPVIEVAAPRLDRAFEDSGRRAGGLVCHQWQRSVLLVDADLCQDLKIEEKLHSDHWHCVRVPKNSCTQALISAVLQKIPQGFDLHLIGHGRPGFLALGKGIDKDQLLKLANAMAAREGRLLVWGCGVGVGLSQEEKNIAGFQVSDSALGHGKALKGYGQLSELVASYGGELFNQGAVKWRSKFGELEASEIPVFDQVDDLWSISANRASLTRQLKIDAKNHIPDEFEIPVKITSTEEDFADWGFTLEEEEGFEFVIPDSIGNPQGKASLSGIKVRNGEIDQWTIKAKADQFNINGFALGGNLEVSFNKQRSTYTVKGDVEIQSGGVLKGDLKATEIELKQIAIDDNGTASWQAQSWQVEGKLETDALRAAGLVVEDGVDAEVVYKLRDADYGDASTYTIQSFNAKIDGDVISGDVQATDVVLKRVTIGEGVNAKQSWQAQSWQVEGKLEKDALSAAGLVVEGGVDAEVVYKLRDADYGDASTYTLQSFNAKIDGDTFGKGLFKAGANVKASDVVLKRTTDSKIKPSWQAQSWSATGDVSFNDENNDININTNAEVNYQLITESVDGEDNQVGRYEISSANVEMKIENPDLGISDPYLVVEATAKDVILIKEEGATDLKAQSWTANGEITLNAGDFKVNTNTEISFTNNHDIYGSDTYTISGGSVNLKNLGFPDSGVASLTNIVLSKPPPGSSSDHASLEIKEWSASAGISIDSAIGKINSNSRFICKYDEDGNPSYEIAEASIVMNADKDSVPFKGEVIAKDIIVEQIDEKLVIKSFSGTGTLQLDDQDTSINAETKAEFEYNYLATDDDVADLNAKNNTQLQSGSGSAQGYEIGDTVYTIKDSKLTVDINQAEASANAQFEYVVPSSTTEASLGNSLIRSQTADQLSASENDAYFRYLIGTIGGDSALTLADGLDLNLSGGLMLGMAENRDGDALWGLNGALRFDGLGLIDSLSFTAGDSINKVDFKEKLIEDVSDPEFGVAEDNAWSFGSLAANVANSGDDNPLIDLGLFKVDGVEAAYGSTDTDNPNPYGLYKYTGNTQPTTVSASSPPEDTLSITATNITLDLGYITQALKPIGKAIKGFTGNIRDIIDILTSQIDLTSNIPSALTSPLISFIESTPGNSFRDGKIQLIEVFDVYQYTANYVHNLQNPDKKPLYSITTSIEEAEQFLNLADVLINLTSETDSGTFLLPKFTYKVDLSLPSDSAEALKSGEEPKSRMSSDIDKDDMEVTGGFESFSKITGQQIKDDDDEIEGTKIEFPLFSKKGVASLLYNYFLDPKALNTLLDLKLATNIAAESEFKSQIPAFPLVKVGMDGQFKLGLQTQIKTEFSVDDLLNIYDQVDISAIDRVIASIADMALSKSKILLQSDTDDEGTKLELHTSLGLTMGLNAQIGSIDAKASIEGDLNLQPKLLGSTGDDLLDNQQYIKLSEIFSALSEDEEQEKLQAHLKPSLGFYKAKIDLDTSALDSDQSNLDTLYYHFNIGYESTIYINQNDPSQFTFEKPDDLSGYLALSSTGWIHYPDSIEEITTNTINLQDKEIEINFNYSEDYRLLDQLTKNIRAQMRPIYRDNAKDIALQVLNLAIPSSTQSTISSINQSISSPEVGILYSTGADDEGFPIASPTVPTDRVPLKDKEKNQATGNFSQLDFITFEKSMKSVDGDKDVTPFLFLDLPSLPNPTADDLTNPPLFITFELGSSDKDILQKIRGRFTDLKEKVNVTEYDSIDFTSLTPQAIEGPSSPSCTLTTQTVRAKDGEDDLNFWKHRVSIALTPDDHSQTYKNLASGEWGLRLDLGEELHNDPYTTGITNPWAQYGYSLGYGNSNFAENANLIKIKEEGINPIEGSALQAQLTWTRPYQADPQVPEISHLDIIDLGNGSIFLHSDVIKSPPKDIGELVIYQGTDEGQKDKRFALKDQWNLAASIYDSETNKHKIGFVSMDSANQDDTRWYESLTTVETDKQGLIPFVSTNIGNADRDADRALGLTGKFESIYNFGLTGNSDLGGFGKNQTISKIIQDIYLSSPQQIVDPTNALSGANFEEKKNKFLYWTYLSSALSNERQNDPSSGVQSVPDSYKLFAYNIDYFNDEYSPSWSRSDRVLNGRYVADLDDIAAGYMVNNNDSAIMLPRNGDNVPRMQNIELELNDQWKKISEWKHDDDSERYRRWQYDAFSIVENFYSDAQYNPSFQTIISNLSEQTGTTTTEYNSNYKLFRSDFEDHYSTLLYSNDLTIARPVPYIEMATNRIFEHQLDDQYDLTDSGGMLTPFPVEKYTKQNDLYINYDASISAALKATAQALWLDPVTLANFEFPILNKNGEFSTGISFNREVPPVSSTLALEAEYMGDDGNNLLTGGSQNDFIDGLLGHDILSGGGGHDFLAGRQGDDLIRGNQGNDEIIGGYGADTLYGGLGDDKLNGGHGIDILTGNRGNDQLQGGEGKDYFIFNRASGTDTILDFNLKEDIIILNGFNNLRNSLEFNNKNTTENQTVIGQIYCNNDLIIKLEGIDVEANAFKDYWHNFISNDLAISQSF